MLTRDLNEVIAQGKNWRLPMFWAPIMRWITAPVLMVILGIGYNDYRTGLVFQRDPLHLFAFILSHLGVGFIIVGFFKPETFAWLSPRSEIESDQRQYVAGPGVTLVREPGTPSRSAVLPTLHETVINEPASAHMA